ncbi:MAG TPA: hypothetical protein VJ011_07890 [Steroidobacteraceae bacterium]|nr:hypothetical protein [Steroidobacteraceae bacterium]
MAIAAHRDGFFRALEHVAIGDRLKIEHLSGTRVYRVSELSIVNPDDMSPLRQTGSVARCHVPAWPIWSTMQHDSDSTRDAIAGDAAATAQAFDPALVPDVQHFGHASLIPRNPGGIAQQPRLSPSKPHAQPPNPR